MASRKPVVAEKGMKSPLFSQAMIHGNTVYVSGNIGIDTATMQLVEGTVGDRTRRALENIQVVLEEAGSSLQNILKINIFLTTMDNYAAMNKVYVEMIHDPKPPRTCVAVAELPFKTDVEIECIASLNVANAPKL